MIKSLSRSEAAKLAHMRRRILAHWGNASAADQAAGIAWYDRAADAARTILPSDPERAAGVIAALSPRCQWRINLAWAAAVIEAAESGADCPSVHTRTMRAQAWRIANGEPALSVLGGPKVRAFYSNIIGNTDRVTVDVWALRAADPGETRVPSGRLYDLTERAYIEAARIVGVAPRDLQAAVWVHVRGAAE